MNRKIKRNSKNNIKISSLKSITLGGFLFFSVSYLAIVDAHSEQILPVAEKVRKTDAKGLKLSENSDIRLFPTLSNNFSYLDNIYGTTTGKVSSFILNEKPNLRLVANFEKYRLLVNVGGEYVKFFKDSALDYFNMDSDVSARVEIQEDLVFTSKIAANISHETPLSSDFPENVKNNIRKTTASGNITLEKKFNKLSLAATGIFVLNNYKDVTDITGTVIDQDVRDNNVYGGGLRFGYEVAPGVQAYVEGKYDKYDYKNLSGGTTDQDYNVMTANLGAAFKLPNVLEGYISVGYAKTKYKNTALSADNSIVYGASLAYLISPKATLNFDASSSSSSTSVSGASSKRTYELNTKVDYELLRDVVLSPGFDFELTKYKGISSSQKKYKPSLSVKYYLNNYLDVGMSYEFTKNKSDVDSTDDYKSHYVGVSLNLKY